MLTDASGTPVWRASYEAYGKAALDQDPDDDLTEVTFNVRFPGQYFDAESGMHYNRHRYYAPELGRYVSADPIGQLGGINVFTYALENPVNFADRLGLSPDDPDDGGSISQSIRDAARRVRDAALDKAIDALLGGKNKAAVCEEKKRECVAQNCPAPNDFQAEYEKCDADYKECSKKAGSQILNEESSGVPDPFGVTGPDIGNSKTPNVIDRYSRGRGKKVE